MTEKDIELTSIKVGILGDGRVGKSAICNSFTGIQFSEETSITIGSAKFEKKLNVAEGKEIKLVIWDTAGQERFRNVTKSYFQSSHGLLVVYDITDRESFEKINFWMENIKKNAPENVKLILVGNKCDLANERKVSYEEGENYAKKFNIKFFESSAKDGTNVKEFFFYLANEIYQDDKTKGKDNKKTMQLNSKKKGKKGCC